MSSCGSDDLAARVTVERVTTADPDLAVLLSATVAELRARYPDYHPEPVVPGADHFVARLDGAPVGCVAVLPVDDPAGAGEIKRLFVAAGARRAGVARRLVRAVEDRVRELGREKVVLETGTRQPEALALYARLGYAPRGPYGAFVDNPYSRFFARDLTGDA